jgi:hypothetical protein
MKKKNKKWTLGLTAAGLLVVALAIVFALNPSLSYAHHTSHGNYEIYHDQALDPAFLRSLDEADSLLKTSELHNKDLKLKICLDDHSPYPDLMAKVRGEAFGWGFYNIVALRGQADYPGNTMEVNGRTWNLTQLLTHEAVHCLQYDALGLWHTRPFAAIPLWKFEGYPEYIARRENDQQDLLHNVLHLQKTLATEHNNWIEFSDGTGTVIPYYEGWLLVQYCLEIKQWTYRQLLEDETTETAIKAEATAWFLSQLAVKEAG